MKRMYVIMREDIREYNPFPEPYDVVSSMVKADEICMEQEEADITHIYYWREVISSEEE